MDKLFLGKPNAGSQNWQHQELLSFLSERLDYFIKDLKPQEIFLITSKQNVHFLEAAIKNPYKKLVKKTVLKNLINAHPFKALEALRETDSGKSVPRSKEARKILGQE